MTTPSLSERRRAPRRVLELEVSFTSDTHIFVGLAGDISTGGVFVASYEPCAVGSDVDIVLTLPTGTVHTRGTVRWVRVGSDAVGPGFGVSFDALSEDARGAIAAFCADREATYYEIDEDAP